ncbi:hypothetical protein F4V43_02215 [Paenibacillus spiritus]|uniref:Uncharacterized protein n=1 Tax=Paenibacillus spiritus TaxID=2496557 RepID=A0A5J5GGN7_9BACL|nr:hypothetical protein [Paenibacillus spiritus]KAA9007321.1 hypothetical protein F4V43_02215 [Paenibacillus spiritus]
MDKYLFYYGDLVEVMEDILTSDNKRQARAGQIGEVQGLATNLHKYIRVKLEGNHRSSELPAWKLRLIKKNEVRREEDEKQNQKDIEEFNKLGIRIGELVKVKRPGSTKIFSVLVTKILDSAIYGYRIKNNGDRYSGSLGQEDCFAMTSILGAKKDLKKDKVTKYNVGDIVPLSVMRYDIYNGAGVIVKCTSRTVHVSYDDNEKPIIYSLREFYRVPYSRDKMQAELYGDNNYSTIKLNVVTAEGKKRLEELGFDVSKVSVVEDPHKR